MHCTTVNPGGCLWKGLFLFRMSDVTRILSQIQSGDRQAGEQLLPLVYDELRKLAAVKLAQEKPGQTLQATALVNEAYLRLVGQESSVRGQEPASWEHRGHFFAAAAEAMRRILIENARRKKSLKRGGDGARLELDEGLMARYDEQFDLLELDDALVAVNLQAAMITCLCRRGADCSDSR
jgi:RNA polymerase sigma factor (TIGR02999 family)